MQAAAGVPAILVLGVLGSLLGVPSALHGQELGFRAGLTSSTISFAPDMGEAPVPVPERRTGFVGGAILFLPTSSRGGWQVEALLHQKGARDLFEVGDRLTLTYLDLPLVLHIDVIQIDTRAVYIVAGPSLAVNVRATYDAAGIANAAAGDIPRLDLGFIAGGGVEYHQLIVDARYTWGRGRILVLADHDGTFRNRAFSATAGIRLRW